MALANRLLLTHPPLVFLGSTHSLQSEQERKQAAEARKERRQTGEIDTLRTRLREMEARQAEKEDELKALKRSLRQKELSLLGGNGVAVDR